jgi:hypothetical protein
MYDLVNFGEQTVSYPRPFQFTIRPNTDHPNAAEAAKVSRLLCLYDNAGESFLPGRDTAANPVTRHLSVSDMLLFCFDPTQDPRFRKACKGKTDDIQVVDAPVSARQETVLHEIGERIRKHSTLHSNERHKRPLVVIVTKYDAWWALLGEERLSMPIVKSKKGVYALNMGAIEQTSAKLRQLLKRHSPELVSAAEGLCEQVIYVPVSATGCGPQVDSETGQIGIRPRDVAPMWCEIPLLTALARWGGGMVPYFRPSAKPHRDPSKYPPGAE